MTNADEPVAAPVSVLVVEDHPAMRDAVAQSVDRTDGFELAGTAASGHEALDALAIESADLVLVDLSLPDMSGADLIAEIGRSSARTRCVVLSGHREPHYVAGARAVGARGYVVKGRPHEVAEALRSVASGGEYYSASIAVDRTGRPPR